MLTRDKGRRVYAEGRDLPPFCPIGSGTCGRVGRLLLGPFSVAL
jgi:hypothetical protein